MPARSGRFGDDHRPNDYRNPILQGFYPDPSITRAGDSIIWSIPPSPGFPGIPVFRSRDLVSWTQIGNAIDRPDMLDFGRLGLSRGVFAPSISAPGRPFYILNTCVDCGGNFVITARDPAGPGRTRSGSPSSRRDRSVAVLRRGRQGPDRQQRRARGARRATMGIGRSGSRRSTPEACARRDRAHGWSTAVSTRRPIRSGSRVRASSSTTAITI
jgi:hypothetical protein